MINCEHLVKSFSGQQVLSDVSFSVKAGEVFVISGASGIGKTTLLDIVAGISKTDRGNVTVATKRIGYAFQDDRLIPWKTVKENLTLVTASYFSESEAEEISTFWLNKMGLLDSADKRPSELSGGMKKRLNIARSLAIDPALLILDEPFAFQDSEYQNLILGEVKILNEKSGTTVLVASHGNVPLWCDNFRGFLVGSIKDLEK